MLSPCEGGRCTRSIGAKTGATWRQLMPSGASATQRCNEPAPRTALNAFKACVLRSLRCTCELQEGGNERMGDRTVVLRLHIRLYGGQDDDLIAWFETLNDLHFGGKSHAVKTALRRGLGLAEGGNGNGNGNGGKPDLDLAEIRAVVEAAVATAVASLGGEIQGGASGSAGKREEEEIEAALDRLGAAVMM